MTKTLTSAERRALRARAHALNPVVSIGQHGLTPSVLHEIDVALLAHELIKIRVANDDRAARELLYAKICAELDAAPVQHIGKLVIVWRLAPEQEPVAARPAARTPVKGTKSAPRAVRGKVKSGAAAIEIRAGRRAPSGSAAAASRRRRGPPSDRGNGASPIERRPPRRRRAP